MNDKFPEEYWMVSQTREAISIYYVESFQRMGNIDVAIITDPEIYEVSVPWKISRMKEKPVATVTRVFVKPALRNQGLATEMMTRLIALLDEQQMDAELSINPYGDLDYEQLRKFYQKFGFIETGLGMFQRFYGVEVPK